MHRIQFYFAITAYSSLSYCCVVVLLSPTSVSFNDSNLLKPHMENLNCFSFCSRAF